MSTWSKVFDRELAKGADHGHAAYMADDAESRARRKDARARLDRVVEAMVDDIMAASDDDILAEAKEDGWTQEDIDYLRKSLLRSARTAP